uniref:Coatomer subunit delta n=2 Tax=Sus scrofa TaxID=9823 RepID=A0A4X1SPF9_PIG
MLNATSGSESFINCKRFRNLNEGAEDGEGTEASGSTQEVEAPGLHGTACVAALRPVSPLTAPRLPAFDPRRFRLETWLEAAILAGGEAAGAPVRGAAGSERLTTALTMIPEYCRALEENEISEHCFDLIFAFDEIVALGYRENVNLAQIRTFTEMDSHEEKVFRAVRETQEREAKAEMRRKAKELQQARRDAERQGKKAPGFGGFGSSTVSGSSTAAMITETIIETDKPKVAPAPARPSGPSKALKLGAKGKEVDNFVDKLKSEGETIMSSNMGKRTSDATKVHAPPINMESVHMKIEEKITLTCGRDGGLQNMELHGMIMLRISDDKFGRIRLHVENEDKKGVQLQTHPNVDKKLFTAESLIGLKNPEKSFPVNSDVGVLKWRLQTTEESFIPLTINCWPSESGNGCDVNIEYELQEDNLELNDVIITIPLPSGVGAPVIGEIDGEYRHDSRRNTLEWCLPVIDAKNKSGSLEFSIAGQPNDFFPVQVSFVSKKNYCNIQVTKVTQVDGNSPVRFSTETTFLVDKYEIL